MSHDDERDHAEEADVRRNAVREGPAELAAERAEQPIDVDAYEAAGVARVEDDECDGSCDCNAGYCRDLDEWCDHCPVCCSCTPCEYASVA